MFKLAKSAYHLNEINEINSFYKGFKSHVTA